jgi:hypothetical protein
LSTSATLVLNGTYETPAAINKYIAQFIKHLVKPRSITPQGDYPTTMNNVEAYRDYWVKIEGMNIKFPMSTQLLDSKGQCPNETITQFDCMITKNILM